MSTLESSLEVLVCHYVSFVVNNLWTWIAVLTATVSFWRIRATTFTNKQEDESIIEPFMKPQTTKASLVPSRVKVTETETEDWIPLMCNDGVTKGKLTVYYYEEEIDGERDDDDDGERDDDDDDDGERDDDDDDDGEFTDVKFGGEESGGLKMRNGDEGWYPYVDLTVINGNVVRLWDANGVRNGDWLVCNQLYKN